MKIERVVLDSQHVTRLAGLDRVAAELLAEL
jgi:hypothetical protein